MPRPHRAEPSRPVVQRVAMTPPAAPEAAIALGAPSGTTMPGVGLALPVDAPHEPPSALALRAQPLANGSYKDGRFELHPRVNVGIAVAAQDALVVPTSDAGGEIVDRKLMTLTLTCDHRILYGADDARFLAAIRDLLEAPLQLAL